MTTDDILFHARQCIGTPFRHQGRLIAFSLDCAGVVIHVARQIGAGVIDVEGYGISPSNGLLERALDSQPCLERVALADKAPGDILLLRIKSDPQHLAIYTGEGIIHAYDPVGMCCEHLLNSLWETRIARVYRFIGVTS